jgi:glutamine phosphoribosylpyrophosphate amidotransferase
MRGKQCGNLYVQWLKDHFVECPSAAEFWIGILARMALRHDVAFDLVTCPPSSEKRDHYLAETLALGVAETLGAPFGRAFINPEPRGHRASMQEKLRERDGAARYVYDREPDGDRILVVDDAMCTRQTALRCVDAAHRAAQESGGDPDDLYFVVIYS